MSVIKGLLIGMFCSHELSDGSFAMKQENFLRSLKRGMRTAEGNDGIEINKKSKLNVRISQPNASWICAQECIPQPIFLSTLQLCTFD